MECKEVRKYLDAYRTHELPEAVYQATENHVSACTDCQNELAFITGLAESAVKLRLKAPSETAFDQLMDQYGKTNTDFGPVWICYTPQGVSAVKIGVEDDRAFEQYYTERIGRKPHRRHVPKKYVGAVQSALRGEKTGKVPISLDGLPEFEQTVLNHLARIPFGEVRPYAWLAREAGNPGAVRAVGSIMARNPVPFLLPCHRIIPSGGGVGNYGYGPEMKRALLEREGVSPGDLEGWKRQHIRYIGSRTTGIYCYPTCRDARRISWENQVSFSSESDATASGYRPCKHCRPL